MKKDLFKFTNIANQNEKCDSPIVIRIMIILMILILIVKILHLDDIRPEIYRKHDVFMFEKPIQITDDYHVIDSSNNKINLNDLLDKNVTILAFWATWCGYCAREFPQIDKIIDNDSYNGIKFLPITKSNDNSKKINQFFKRAEIKNLTNVIAENNALYEKFEIRGYPTFIAVNKNGMAFAKLRPKWEDPNILDLFTKLQQEE